MTPPELLARNVAGTILAAGATVPVYSLLLSALAGEKFESPSSGIAVNVHISGQHAEPLPIYTFTVSATLSAAVDDDKDGRLFKHNHDILWRVFDRLARGDTCREIGALGVFEVDGLQFLESDPPDFSEDDNGGSFNITFAVQVTGRA